MKNDKIIKYIKYIIYIFVTLFTGYTLYKIITMDIIPSKYINISIIATVIFLLVMYLFLFLKNKVLNILSIIFIIVLSVGLFFVNGILTNFNTFLDNIVDNKQYITYNLVVKKEFSEELEDYNNKLIGMLETDVDKSIKFLEDSLIKDYQVKQNNITASIYELEQNSISTLVINDSFVALLKENEDIKFDEKFKVIYSKKYVIDSESNNGLNPAKESFNVMISGIDTYGSINNVSRSDVNILLTINPNTESILVTHIARDAYVNLYGVNSYLKDKLTHTGIYGVDMTTNTVAQLLDVNIDYYVKINFSTLEKTIDALGGITVLNDETFSSSGTTFKEGVISLDGSDALKYARERKSLEGGDVKRGEHQQQIIEGIINKATEPSTLLNYAEILTSLENTFITNISKELINGFIKFQLEDMPNWEIENFSVLGLNSSNEPTYTYPDMELYVMHLDQNIVNEATNLIKSYLK